MSRQIVLSLLTASGLATSAFAADSNLGIVNFNTCISDSKLGKQEQASFEVLKKQMSTLLEDTDKQLQELANKFNDQDYLDGLSPEAEKELKNKYEALSQDYQRYQNQSYQALNQTNMRIVQSLSSSIGEAAEKVAKNKKLAMVVNKDACFFYAPVLDVTIDVIAEMDKVFATQENAVQESAAKTSDAKADPKAETKK